MTSRIRSALGRRSCRKHVASIVRCAIFLSATALASGAVPATTNSAPSGGPSYSSRVRHLPSPYAAASKSVRATNFWALKYGVDSMVVKAVPADQVIRFSYRIINADKARGVVSKEAAPQLIDDRSGVALVVPTMDKVGQLRQSGPPQNGKIYWMVFSNKGNAVKKGHRVTVMIGDFHVNDLAVE